MKRFVLLSIMALSGCSAPLVTEPKPKTQEIMNDLPSAHPAEVDLVKQNREEREKRRLQHEKTGLIIKRKFTEEVDPDKVFTQENFKDKREAFKEKTESTGSETPQGEPEATPQPEVTTPEPPKPGPQPPTGRGAPPGANSSSGMSGGGGPGSGAMPPPMGGSGGGPR